MLHSEFKIGLEFWINHNKFKCTDIGTRTIIAIKPNIFDDEEWTPGPPYAGAEIVLDEYDLPACSLEEDDK